jgi:hypothetical protein
MMTGEVQEQGRVAVGVFAAFEAWNLTKWRYSCLLPSGLAGFKQNVL